MNETKSIDRIIAYNLSQKREERGETRKEFSSFLGIPYRSYVNYENETQRPPLKKLIAISNKLGMTLSSLIGR